MNVQVHHVHVHTDEQVREIIAAAGRIADASGSEGYRWARVFEQACALLGARHTIALAPEPMPVQLPQMAITRNRH